MSQQYLNSSDEERKTLISRSRGGDMTVSNKEVAEAFAIDPNYDPYSVPLDKVDPSHPTLFLHGTHWAHLERLRKEDPVHFNEIDSAGRYWSVTKYDDIKTVSSDWKTFSSAHGITLGFRVGTKVPQFFRHAVLNGPLMPLIPRSPVIETRGVE